MENSGRAFELLQSGDADGLRRHFEAHPAAAEARDVAGVSLVMHALYRGRRDLAELIADKKEELDIFEAASLGRLDRLRSCLDRARLGSASEINAQSKDGFTALHFACFFGQPDAVRILIENGAAVDAVASSPMRVMPLHSAASVRNLEAARLLLEQGAPGMVNARQHGGWVALHSAAQNGDRPMVELLLKHHADTKIESDEGKTAAAVAREKGHADLATLLENRS